MIPLSHPGVQRGATLAVGLILLALITIMVLAAYRLSSTNLKTVGNIQAREEAVAAANVAIERSMSSGVLDSLINKAGNPAVFESVEVDIDGNGSVDYYVKVAAIECKQAVPAPADLTAFSGVSSGIPNTAGFDTVWELRAVVTDSAYSGSFDPASPAAKSADQATGAVITVVHGVRRRLDSLNINLTKCQ